MAALLYLGSGIGLGGARLVSAALGRAPTEAPLRRGDLPWLAGAIVTGGGIGPVLLLVGLSGTTASQASLLLNLEGVLTAALAWLAFREHVDARIAVGMVAITGGAVVLTWQPGIGLRLDPAALCVAGACLAWAVDNNLTRKVSGGDPVLVAALKGGAAGAANLVIALAAGAERPGLATVLGAGTVGLVGYGLSLTLFVRALRDLGAARTGAYFSTAPFVGALASVAALGEPVTPRLAVAGLLMLLGVWLHVSERHGHEHAHDPLVHEHLHRHDGHHDHDHPAGTPADERHAHPHAHPPVRHGHPHYPDLHHRHRH